MHSEFEGHRDFVKGEDARNWDKQFGIRHYAGVVTYSVEGFVDKNRDSQQDVFFDSLAKSKSSFINELCEFKVSLIQTNENFAFSQIVDESIKAKKNFFKKRFFWLM